MTVMWWRERERGRREKRDTERREIQREVEMDKEREGDKERERERMFGIEQYKQQTDTLCVLHLILICTCFGNYRCKNVRIVDAERERERERERDCTIKL